MTSADVTEEMVRRLVHGFYAQVRRDPELAPIFDRAVGAAWDAHLADMCDFWGSVLLAEGRFKGAPLAARVVLQDIRPRHIARWLQLLRASAWAFCPPNVAGLVTARAQAIATSLEIGVSAELRRP